MDWFKDFIKSLPLEEISEQLAKLVMWWSELVQGIPGDELPLIVYLGGSVIVCLLWFFIARILPRQVSIMSWIVLIAILFTPSVALGNNGEIVPACVAIVYSILMKNTYGIIINILPILSVIVTCFFLVVIWHVLQMVLIQNQQEEPIDITKEMKIFVKNSSTEMKYLVKNGRTKVKPFIKNSATKTKTLIKNGATRVKPFVKDNTTKVKNLVKNSRTEVKPFIKNSTTKVKTFVKNSGTKVTPFIKNSGTKVTLFIKNSATKIKNFVKTSVRKTKIFVQKIIKKYKKAK